MGWPNENVGSGASLTPFPANGLYPDGEVYYVDTAGSDSNLGTSESPFLTVAYAASQVTTPGSTIYVNAGTYLETAQIVLSVGVSLMGAGVTSIIKANYAADKILYLNSTVEGTDGNQSISYLKFDGNALTGINGIYIQGRSNVKIFHVTAVDWLNNFVTFNGRGDNSYCFSPKRFAVGNRLYNCSISNCDRYVTNGSGAVQYGGQDGIEIYNNVITSNRGNSSQTGWPIKYYLSGYNKNDKIYNNNLTKPDMDGTGGFGFLIEMWHGLGGTEVYSNTLTGGAMDANCYDKGSSEYSLDFYDNVMKSASMATVFTCCLSLESSADDVIFRNNFVYNCAAGGAAVYTYSHLTQPHYNNIKIFNNIVVDSRLTVHSASGTGSTATFNNWLIANNTIYRNTAGTQAIMLPRYGKSSNIQVRNNIVSGFTTSAVEYDGGSTATLDNVSIENNLFYNCGNSNLFKISGASQPTNVTTQNQVNTNPAFVDVANGVVATAMTANKLYRIASIGTTDFTLIGAASNTVGLWFKATGAGTGTGTADALDLRIPVGSPAVNIGIQVGLNVDYRGLRRTSLPDAGALEYDENADGTNVAQPLLLS